MSNTRSARIGSFPTSVRATHGSEGAIWHKSAPSVVRRASSSGDHAGAWEAWKRHLKRRQVPIELARLLPAKSDPMSWALPDGIDRRPAPAWLELAEGLLRRGQRPDASLEKRLLGWLGESTGGAMGAGCALEVLACCHALPRLAALLPADVWFALLDHLLVTVGDAGGIDMEEDPLGHQLLAGELPLTLAYLLPEISACRKLKAGARRALSCGAVDLLDGEGLPHARHLVLLRPLLACWTRCGVLGEQLKGGCWSASAEVQYQWLIRHALRLARHDGTQAFSNGARGGWCAGLFKTALESGDDDDRRIAALVLPGREKQANRRPGKRALPEAATHSEWASVAVLRPQWSRSGQRLTVSYGDRSLQTELSCGKDVLWSGAWELDVWLDGQPAAPVADWEQLCWVSDEDVDYLELQIEIGGHGLGGGLWVQRQFVLARRDGFLLLADAVLGEKPCKIEYRGCLPLCPGIALRRADESRDGLLVGRKPRASVLPLALPEWQLDRRIGGLVQSDDGLQLRQSLHGRRMYAPLFFDLDRRRRSRPVTWRQLTIAESLAIQPPDVAAGYRVAVGTEQWLIYRSLAERANRTLLGHNLSTEMLVGRFSSSGKVTPLIEIE
ncbi:MAG: hypothetical protein A2V70_18605 [Planctomycetes bacterium RBG_13_63_9]|nr:MAG: hypothetical protein A2V70_18605 [Planctomycetes bacterium RBG_13_63_9]